MIRFLASGLLLASLPAQAIVDVHEDYYANPDVAEFSTFEFSFEGASGTKDESDVAFENHTILRRGQSTFMFIGALQYAEINDETDEDNQFFHLRYVRDVKGRHGFDLLAQYSKDEFELIDRRTVFGGGYRYEWWEGDRGQAGLLGIGAIHEQESYVDRVAEQELWRANLYAHVETPLHVASDTALSFSTYLQPAFEDTGDVRAIAIMNLSTALTERLDLELTIDYSHDSEPEPGIDRNNWSYSTGITWTLR